jgi:hypothetical protein
MQNNNLNDVLSRFELLSNEEKLYFLKIAKKQIIESLRNKIVERVKEADENYKAGNYSAGNYEDLLNDLDDD